MCDRGRGIDGDGVVGRLVDVLPEVESGPSRPNAGRPPEVVDRASMDPGLGEPNSELPVEEVKPSDVRQDDDARPTFVVGGCAMGAEAVAVLGREYELTLPADGSTLPS